MSEAADNFYIDVFYKVPGVQEEQRARWMNIHPEFAIKKTQRKYKSGYDFRTVTYHPSQVKKYIPDPPEGWQHARFKMKMKKNRFGMLIHDRPEEID